MSESTVSGRLSERGVAGAGVTMAQGVAFWAAICLPFVHLTLLATAGLTETTRPVLATLWTANVLALVVGHRYAPAAETGRSGGDRR